MNYFRLVYYISAPLGVNFFCITCPLSSCAMELVGIVLEVVSLAFLTLTEIVVFITNGLSGSSNASKFGFVNGTAAISDKYYTQVSSQLYTQVHLIILFNILDHTSRIYLQHMGCDIYMGSFMDYICLVLCFPSTNSANYIHRSVLAQNSSQLLEYSLDILVWQ